jgi:hypothetical protein
MWVPVGPSEIAPIIHNIYGQFENMVDYDGSAELPIKFTFHSKNNRLVTMASWMNYQRSKRAMKKIDGAVVNLEKECRVKFLE